MTIPKSEVPTEVTNTFHTYFIAFINNLKIKTNTSYPTNRIKINQISYVTLDPLIIKLICF